MFQKPKYQILKYLRHRFIYVHRVGTIRMNNKPWHTELDKNRRIQLISTTCQLINQSIPYDFLLYDHSSESTSIEIIKTRRWHLLLLAYRTKQTCTTSVHTSVVQSNPFTGHSIHSTTPLYIHRVQGSCTSTTSYS